MTVIGRSERGSLYWHEAFEKAKGPNPAKALALLYLVMGEDYVYNVVKRFKNSTLNFKALQDPNQLQPILKDLEKKALLISRKKNVDGRDRKYFSINPEILYSPDGSKIYQRKTDALDLRISEVAIHDFLQDLKRRHLKNEDMNRFFKNWSRIKCFDFRTFLESLLEMAADQKKDDLSRHFEAYINEIGLLEREKRRWVRKAITLKWGSDGPKPRLP